MPNDLKAILKDKRLLYGLGLAAVAGLAVLWQRSKSGTGSSGGSTSTGTVSGATYTGAGTVDTTGTDVASWLGSYSASLQAQMDAQNKTVQEQLANYEKSLTTAISGLGTMSGDTSTTDYRSVQITSGNWLDQVLKDNNLTLEQLVKYNPGISDKLRQSDIQGWVSSTNPADWQSQRLSFYGDQTIKVPK